ncbi:hypothetical protein BDV06DRAFT_196962 [Aspergillus oleicola]
MCLARYSLISRHILDLIFPSANPFILCKPDALPWGTPRIALATRAMPHPTGSRKRVTLSSFVLRHMSRSAVAADAVNLC